ncbi:MAG: response regulator [Ignavibacteriaceae bacterium]|nr:response regulator [Ignavibacteriaceae bacterium]
MQTDDFNNLTREGEKPEGKIVMRTLRIFGAVWESSIDAMRLCNSQGIMIYVNHSFCELFEKSESELIGESFASLQQSDEESYKTIVNNFHLTMTKREPRYRFEGEFTLWNGKKKWVEVSNSFIEVEEGLLLLSIFREITDRKKTEVDLIAAKEKAEEANQIKSAFLTNMSHELRTPLIGIMGFTEILQEKLTDLEDQEMLSKIMKSSLRLLNTFESIFDLSMLESNRIEHQFKLISLNKSIKKVFDEFQPKAAEKELSFRLYLPAADVQGLFDETILYKTIRNLVDNAIKYTSKGTVSVKLDVQRSSHEDFALISVSDTGIGIPSASVSFVFDSFRQVSEGFSRGFEGSGLGLTLTKKFVQFLGGSIAVESQEAVGSTFYVTLPIKTEVKALSPDQLPHGQKYNKQRLLIVDDDSIARDVMKLILSKDYDLEEAFSYDSAMETLEKEKFDAVLLDIMLGRDKIGINIAKMLREREDYKNTPLIAVTALAMTGDKERILGSGCSHYISKPFKKNDLLNLVKDALLQAG